MGAFLSKWPRWIAAAQACLLGVAYLAAAELGHTFSFAGNFATFWPPSGLLVAVLLIAHRHRWPLLLVMTLGANLLSDVAIHGKPVPVSLGFWLANAAEAIAGAAIVQRLSGLPFRLDRLRNVLLFYAVPAIATPMLGAAIGAAVAVAAFGGPYWSTWVVWWISDVVGVVVFAPVILSGMTCLSTLRREVPAARVIEFCVLLTGLVLFVEFVFGYRSHPLVWTILPFMLWAALRFGVLGVSTAILLLAILMSKNTALGRGPFAEDWTPVEQMLLARTYLLLTGISYITVAVALSERHRAMAQIVESEEKLRELYDNMDEYVLSVAPDGRFLSGNRAWRTALRCTETELLSMSLQQIIHPEDLEQFHSDLQRQLAGGKNGVQFRAVTKSGAVLHIEGTTEFVFREGLPVYSRSIFRDVTRRKEQEAQIDAYQRQLEEANARWELLATSDGLTRLKNRRAFQAKLNEEVDRTWRYRTPLSLMLVDVDHFKKFNDSFGHPAGDGVLRGVAQVLKDAARTTDFVARYGGEEFGIILPNTDEESAISVAERFRQAVEDADWRERPMTVSIGVATLNCGELEPSEFIGAADAALYHSKENGRNCTSHANRCDGLKIVSDPHDRLRDSRWSLPTPLMLGLSGIELTRPAEL